MKVWTKKAEKESSARGVSRAALDGASRRELLHEALSALSRQEPAARLGVWLDADESARSQPENIAGLHGLTWYRKKRQSPQGWHHLPVLPPLQTELLLRR